MIIKNEIIKNGERKIKREREIVRERESERTRLSGDRMQYLTGQDCSPTTLLERIARVIVHSPGFFLHEGLPCLKT